MLSVYLLVCLSKNYVVCLLAGLLIVEFCCLFTCWFAYRRILLSVYLLVCLSKNFVVCLLAGLLIVEFCCLFTCWFAYRRIMLSVDCWYLQNGNIVASFNRKIFSFVNKQTSKLCLYGKIFLVQNVYFNDALNTFYLRI